MSTIVEVQDNVQVIDITVVDEDNTVTLQPVINRSGGGGGDLLASNNLSDLDNVNTAISNLGITATATELNYVDGVTSNIQTQLNNLDGRATYIKATKRESQSKTDDVLLLDNDLKFELERDSHYKIEVSVVYQSSEEAGFKFKLQVPGGATGVKYFKSEEIINISTSLTDTVVLGGVAGSAIVIDLVVLIDTTNGGTFGFQWAQEIKTEDNTTLVKGSTMLGFK